MKKTLHFGNPVRLKRRANPLICLCLGLLLLTGCESIELESQWLEGDIAVDGRSDDWVDKLTYIEDSHVSFGLRNDKDALYFCLISEEPVLVNQILRQGLNIWIDPNGGKEKVLGIQFPLSLRERREGLDPAGEEGDREPRPLPRGGMDRSGGFDTERMTVRLLRNLTELVILEPKKEGRRRLDLDEVPGIELKIRGGTGLLVYEGKIPLTQSESTPWAIGAGTAPVFGLGLEIPEGEIGAMGRRPGGGPAGRGGRGGGRGGMGRRGVGGGAMGGSPGRSGMSRPKPLKLWARVALAGLTEERE